MTHHTDFSNLLIAVKKHAELPIIRGFSFWHADDELNAFGIVHESFEWALRDVLKIAWFKHWVNYHEYRTELSIYEDLLHSRLQLKQKILNTDDREKVRTLEKEDAELIEKIELLERNLSNIGNLKIARELGFLAINPSENPFEQHAEHGLYEAWFEGWNKQYRFKSILYFARQYQYHHKEPPTVAVVAAAFYLTLEQVEAVCDGPYLYLSGHDDLPAGEKCVEVDGE